MASSSRLDLSFAAGWALAVTMVGYPVAGLMGSALNWDSTSASIPFRIGVVVLSAILLAFGPPIGTWMRRSPWLALFALLYLLRLLWDVGAADVPGAGTALTYFTVAVLIPVAALGLVATQLREQQAAHALALLGGLACLMALVMHFWGLGLDRSLTEATQRLSFEAVNPITLGHVAVTSIIAVLALARARATLLRTLLLPAVVLVALACLVLAASRGPFLALVICFSAYLLSIGGWRKKVVLAGAGLLIGIAALSGTDEHFQSLLRLADLEEDESFQQRLALQTDAVAQFLSSPLFGSAFIELESLDYPHNLFIEAAMALGVIGLLATCALVWLAAVQFIRRMRAGEILVPLLLMQYFIAIQFSGSLWGSTSFWAIMAVALGAPRPRLPRWAGHRKRKDPRPLLTGALVGVGGKTSA